MTASRPLRRDAWFWLLGLLAVTTAANAAWMLADPLRWYHDLPAGVPDTGPYNEHFVRDIGCAFAVMAAALAWAALAPRWRPPLVGIAALFLVAHAALHVFDTARGFLDSHHWWLDLPGVYLPALVTAVLALHLLRADARRATP
jgi:hypothetical protein